MKDLPVNFLDSPPRIAIPRANRSSTITFMAKRGRAREVACWSRTKVAWLGRVTWSRRMRMRKSLSSQITLAAAVTAEQGKSMACLQISRKRPKEWKELGGRRTRAFTMRGPKRHKKWWNRGILRSRCSRKRRSKTALLVLISEEKLERTRCRVRVPGQLIMVTLVVRVIRGRGRWRRRSQRSFLKRISSGRIKYSSQIKS